MVLVLLCHVLKVFKVYNTILIILIRQTIQVGVADLLGAFTFYYQSTSIST